ncbi:hypothetical protein [Caballeronia sp. GACF4]|uniref:hypothetical protein n=1 Tax=Caballeronia sp. GACF4 TaxID=2921763 RepID=UPI0020297543|nr:hypothetical protein [Caballeronia sp. GACF4]
MIAISKPDFPAGRDKAMCLLVGPDASNTRENAVVVKVQKVLALVGYAPIKKIKKVTTVHLDPVKRSDRAGNDVLAVHFYPDDHVEFEFRNDFSGSRFEYGKVDEWFQTKYGKAANPDDLDWAAAYRRTTRVAVQGWMKYRFTDTVDLEQYVYYTLLVNPKFDEHPAVQRIVMESKGKPGAFDLAMQKMPADVVREIKSNKFDHLANGSKVGQADSI